MNYAEITTLALSYADRQQDAEVSERMNDFLRMAESRINRAFRVRKMSVRATLNLVEDQAYYGLPSDFAGLRDIEIYDTSNINAKTTLKYLTPEKMNALNASQTSIPAGENGFIGYTIIADQIQIAPTQDSTRVMEIVYYQNLRPLTSTNNENWVSIYVPDAYINGLMTEISAFTKDKEASMLWDQRFIASLNEIESTDDSDRWSGTPMEIRVG